MIKWIIYLSTITGPKQTLIVSIDNDSITYYVDKYVTKKIVHMDEERQIFVFNGGFVHVGWKYVNIEFTNGRRKYKIKRIAKL